MLTQAYLKELFDYHSDGYLVWKKKISRRVLVGKKAGHLSKSGYVTIRINKKLYFSHRLVFMYMNNYLPEFIDHKDGNRSNNKIENLRPATSSQNNSNRKASNYGIGFKGVSNRKDSGKFRAYVDKDGKRIHLGCYKTFLEAATVASKTRKELHKEFAKDF